MRIFDLSLRNFRCYKEFDIDLSSDVTVIYGRNGVGKTALFDAIEFALLGSVGRFSQASEAPDYLVHRFADGPVDVRITFDARGNEWVRSTREVRNKQVAIDSSRGCKNRRDFLYETLVHEDYAPPRREIEPISELFRSTVLLSQDLIRGFIEGEASERARILSGIAGSAYYQRCADKARQVIDEIRKRDKTVQQEIRLIAEQIAELRSRLADRDSRLSEVRRSLGSSPMSFEDVMEALTRAGITSDQLGASASDNAFEFASGARSVAEERQRVGRDRLAALEDLSASAGRYAERQATKAQLEQRLRECQGEMDTVTSRRDQAMSMWKQAETALADARQQESNAETQVGIWAKALAAIDRLDELGTRINPANTSLDLHRGQMATIAAKRDQEQLTLSSARVEKDKVRTLAIQAGQRVKRLEALALKLSTFDAAKKEIDSLGTGLATLRQKRASVSKDTEALRAHADALLLAKGDCETLLDSVRASHDEYQRLVAQFRKYIVAPVCPLCGATHESSKSLLSKVDLLLHSVPDQVKELTKRSQDIQAEIARTSVTGKSLSRLLEQIDSDTSDLEKKLQASDSWVRQVEAEARSLRVKADPATITELLSTSRAEMVELDRQAASLDGDIASMEYSISQHSAAMESEEKSVQTCENRLSTLENEVSDLHAELNRMGFDTSYTHDRIAKSLNGWSESLKNTKTEIESLAGQVGRLRSDWQACSSNLERLEAACNADRQELQDIAFEDSHYHSMCRHLTGTDAPSSGEITNQLALARRQLGLLDSLLKAIDGYEGATRARQLDIERKSIADEFEAVEAKHQCSGRQSSALQNAEREVVGWVSLLSESVNRVVIDRIEEHKPEILRLFSSMLPNPYLFSGITMHPTEAGVLLGLRYRNDSTDAGEPRFFLSNAQANVLALSIFLSLAMGQKWARLDTVLLDDPVQHLDDLNAVALIDNLRALALGKLGARKQIVVATCDQSLYALMIRKFGMAENAGLSFAAVSLFERGMQGPGSHYDWVNNPSLPK